MMVELVLLTAESFDGGLILESTRNVMLVLGTDLLVLLVTLALKLVERLVKFVKLTILITVKLLSMTWLAPDPITVMLL